MDIKIAQQMTITELVLENQKMKLDAQREAEHHDRMVGELEKVYRERDKAQEEVKYLIRKLKVWSKYLTAEQIFNSEDELEKEAK